MVSITGTVIDEIDIIDTDTHVMEPPDLWTSRLSSAKWGDAVPHVQFDEKMGRDRWIIGGRKLTSVPNWAWAGWPEYPPSHPPRVEDADPAAWNPKARLAKMDEYGIYASVIFPNILAFLLFAFRTIDPKLQIECIRAYNDFQVEFADPDPDRFVALTVLPFWDVDESLREMARAHEMGHRGILFIGKPHKLGLPRIDDDHWAPLLKAAEERQLSVNFHTAFQELTEEDFRAQLGRSVTRPDYVKVSALGMISLAETFADVLLTDVCQKYPGIRFVNVESGFGWMAYLAELLDWQWLNSGAAQAHPERELPSFYFRRNCMSTFWFEQTIISRLVADYADNVMFETDFPHPTSLSPGPASSSDVPRVMAAKSFEGVAEDVVRKVLYDNAAKLYHIRGRTA
jgi:predicted TIM-barrel fold metal-dependent hydrolase